MLKKNVFSVVINCSYFLIKSLIPRYHTTPLMLASRGGKLETVKLLLEKGASVNSQDYRGWTVSIYLFILKKCLCLF